MELNNAYVRITSGQTRQGVQIENTVFRLLGHLGKDPNGTYITVDGTGHEGLRQSKVRIYLRPTDYTMIDAKTGETTVQVEAGSTDPRTDEEISTELKETFEILSDMTEAVATGVVKGLIISGPAGIGKSHTVETALDQTLGVVAKLRSEEPKYDVVKGHVSPIMLYTMLYRYSSEGSVLVLDDCDVLEDIDAMNILKSALDTKKVRKIHWGSAGYVLEKEGVPSSFDFRGGVIFLTNAKLNKIKTGKIAPHCEAICSRVHYIDLQMNTMRERLIHISTTVMSTDMMDDYEFSQSEKQHLLDWLLDNVDSIAQVDLRTVIKAADLMKAMPNNWKSRAARTLFKGK